ncbi:MAG TPA: amino acid adenylation domain-containing protein, partial [Burkholderiaceae bacterium]|nr:amino acid adenylation domain-containing protein [Burkholderiaceae bacterium]
SNPAFDSSTLEVWGSLLNGACVVVVPQPALLDPTVLQPLLQRQRVSVLILVAGVLRAYAPVLAGALPTLRLLLTGGDVADPHAHALLLQGGLGTLLQTYGPTETTQFVTTFAQHAPPHPAARIPIGRPVANTRLHILDAHGQPVPIGVAGEIHIAGVQVARGYLNRPELTAERFVPDPFGPAGSRMYRSGDLGRWKPDGTVEFLGRNDQQVKIRGFRIELGEIEAALMACPGVREAVVLAREDEPGNKRLVAYLTGSQLQPEALRAALARSLPEYMVPAAYVLLEALPLTPNGKLDRKALPAPDGNAFGARSFEPPHGEIEATLAAVWSELLGIEQVGRHDNFFELGGHSLLAVQVIERMHALGWQLPVRELFVSPTLAALAHAIGAHSAVAVPPNLIPEGCTRITPEMLPLVQLQQAEIDAIVRTVEGGAPNVQDIYPLAPLQEGLLFHALMAAGQDGYLLSQLLAFDSRARLDSFVRALGRVFVRHDILRTAIVWRELREPVQVVWRHAPLPLHEVAADAGQDPAARLQAWADERRASFDLQRAPLVQLGMAHDEHNGRWLLQLLHHHIVSDHTTIDLLVQEVQAHLLGHQESAAAMPFRDFVTQARLGTSAAAHEAFFTELLGDVHEPTTPFGLTDVLGDGPAGLEATAPLPAALAAAVRAQARALGVSAASLFHLAFALVLARTSARADVVFGTVLFGRMHAGAGAHRALGLFMNTLPLRLRLDTTGVAAAVRRTHALLARLLQHEHASLALAQRCSGVPAPAPLFSALLNFRYGGTPGAVDLALPDADDGTSAWAGMVSLALHDRANYPLVLSVDDFGEQFALQVQTDARVQPQRVIDYMLEALQQLAQALAQAPSTPACTLQVLPEAECSRLQRTFNATEAALPERLLIHQLFERQAERSPGAPALVFEHTTLSYARLNERANRLAHHLAALGVRPDARVAICLPRGIDMVVALLAVLKAGGAHVPLDPEYPPQRLAFMVQDCGATLWLTDARTRQTLGPWPAALQPLLLDDPAAWQDLPGTNLDAVTARLHPFHLAYVIYTSGSTGVPKGVMVPHGAVANLHAALESRIYAAAPDTCRVSLNASLAFDASVQQWIQLASGRSLIVVPEDVRRDPAMLRRFVEAQRIDGLDITPSQLQLLEQAPARPGHGHPRVMLVGGEAITPSLWQRLGQAAGCRAFNVYGPAECTVDSSIASVDATSAGGPNIGRPLPNARIHILDVHGLPAPIGVAGEIHIAGAGLARGYLNRPDLTAERFVPDPFGPMGSRMYRTGDLGRWRDDGTLEFLGRNDHQVKIRGFRIELGEIEAALLACPGVREAVVLAREDEPGNRRLVAYLTGTGLQPEALRAHLARSVPEYMVPVAYVLLEALPLTPNGKLDRKALPTPESSAFGAAQFEAPEGETECALAAIWYELLGHEQIGRNDDFFELGGHSLVAVQMASRIRSSLGVEIRVADIFIHATLKELAAVVAEAFASLLPAILPADRSVPLPLSFAQQRLWFLDRLDERAGAAYHIPLGVRLQGRLDGPALQAALD